MKSTYSGTTRPQTGFGIIEIMIALGLGVIIMLGVTQIATNNSSVRWELDRSGRQIENAAYALREIESDLTNAGFWGEMGAQAVGTVPPICPDEIDTTPANDELRQMLAFPVQGGTGAFPCVTTSSSSITPKVGTDYLAIRRASSCALGSVGCDLAGSNFHLQVNSCFVPSDDAAPLPGIDYIIDTNLAKLVYEQRDCDPSNLAPRYRILNRIYYLNDDDQLVRAELVGNTYVQTTLVEGVEMMRFEYGMDRDGDGQVDDDEYGFTLDPTIDPDDPVGSPIPEAWAEVVMVRIHLVVRNVDPSAGFVDNKDYTVAGENYDVPAEFLKHRRQVYSRTVGLRNVAGRRQR